MQTVNIHEAKTHLSKLIEKAVNGEPFIIAKAGKPMVQVQAIMPAEKPKGLRPMGTLRGKYNIPDDIKAFARDEIQEMFYRNPKKHSPIPKEKRKKRA